MHKHMHFHICTHMYNIHTYIQTTEKHTHAHIHTTINVRDISTNNDLRYKEDRESLGKK